MSFYRKKPVVIEALQWDGSMDSYETIHARWPELEDSGLTSHKGNRTIQGWSVRTLEGRHIVSVGDYIIKGVNGEFYPCKPDIFKLTYEATACSITQITEAEQRLTSMLRTCTEALKQVTAERDKLAAELASLRDSGVELPEPDKLRVWGSPTRYYTESMLRDYGDRRAMAERERAAKVCMDMNHGWCSDDAMACAEAIRKGETA